MSEASPTLFAFDIVSGVPPKEAMVDVSAPPPLPPGGFRWVHFERSGPETDEAIQSLCALDPIILDELKSRETRPRTTPFGEGLIVNLRGINHNPGAEPEDLLALHLWVSRRLIVSVSEGALLAVKALRDELAAGRGPHGPAELLSFIVLRLTDHMAPVVTELAERLDGLEELSISGGVSIRRDLATLRREAITLRRYVAPQREALMRLSIEPSPLIDEGQRLRLREAANEMTLFVEELDLVRERASLLSELIYDLRAEEMNQTMVVLAVVTVIFLPLNLLASLLGMNVHGIPYATEPWAFVAVCAVVFALSAIGLYVFRKLKWI